MSSLCQASILKSQMVPFEASRWPSWSEIRISLVHRLSRSYGITSRAMTSRILKTDARFCVTSP